MHCAAYGPKYCSRECQQHDWLNGHKAGGCEAEQARRAAEKQQQQQQQSQQDQSKS